MKPKRSWVLMAAVVVKVVVVVPVCPPCVVSTGDSMTIVTTVVGVPGGGTEGIRAPSVMVTVMRVGEGLKPPGRKGDCGARASG